MSDKDTIYRQDAIEAVCTVVMGMSDYPLTYAYEIAEEALEEVPPAEPRKKGKWIQIDAGYFDYVKCSQCGETLYWRKNFCPNCGADMREGEENE